MISVVLLEYKTTAKVSIVFFILCYNIIWNWKIYFFGEFSYEHHNRQRFI